MPSRPRPLHRSWTWCSGHEIQAPAEKVLKPEALEALEALLRSRACKGPFQLRLPPFASSLRLSLQTSFRRGSRVKCAGDRRPVLLSFCLSRQTCFLPKMAGLHASSELSLVLSPMQHSQSASSSVPPSGQQEGLAHYNQQSSQ